MLRGALFSKESLPKLSDEDRLAFDAAERVITSNIESETDELIQFIFKFPVQLLERLYLYSKITDSKFYHFTKSSKFHDALVKKLQTVNCISTEISSMDHSVHIDLIDILLAVKHLTFYYENLSMARRSDEAKSSCQDSFESACKLGLYNGLIIRCQRNSNVIVNATSSEEDINKAIDSILEDVKRLINLYWAMGYVQAGNIFQRISKNLFERQGENDRSILFYEGSIQYYICATLIEKNAVSKKIELSLTKGNGFLAEMKEEGAEVSSMEDARLILHNWSGDNAIYEKLLNQANEEVASYIVDKAKPSLT